MLRNSLEVSSCRRRVRCLTIKLNVVETGASRRMFVVGFDRTNFPPSISALHVAPLERQASFPFSTPCAVSTAKQNNRRLKCVSGLMQPQVLHHCLFFIQLQ